MPVASNEHKLAGKLRKNDINYDNRINKINHIN